MSLYVSDYPEDEQTATVIREMLPDAFRDIFAAALHGEPCFVVGLDDQPLPVPVKRWSAPASDDDHAMLALCAGPTLDVGCGPGRLTQALTESGHLTLGIDVAEPAVALTRARGAQAVHRDVFDHVPGEGHWSTALLADGNIGIGGDPVALASRLWEVLEPDGRIVVELAAPGIPSASQVVTLVCGDRRSAPFDWAIVGADDAESLAESSGSTLVSLHALGDRWAAVLARDPS